MRRTFSLLSAIASITFVDAQNFSRKQVLDDLSYLKSSLEETHYDLYAYTSKEDFDQNFESIYLSLEKDSFDLLEATRLFQCVISKANNGHTEISFPGSIYAEYAYAGGVIFPLEVALENGKVLIRKNWSSNEEIKIGAELIGINGMSMQEILDKFSLYISAERPYFKHAKIELYSLPRLYWYAYGPQDSYQVEILQEGQRQTYSLTGVRALEDFEMKREAMLNTTRQLELHDPAAYLNPGPFSGDEPTYQQFIDSAFSVIREKNINNLIIDLRNNSGGNEPFSDYLVSYIADRPFKWNSSFTLKTSAILKADVRQKRDTSQAYWKEVLAHQNGEIYDFEFEPYQPQPPGLRFQGAVYVLVNRQSHSQSAVTAAQIQDYSFGTIVGEETGDYPTLYASQFEYLLPHTGIPVKVSKGRIVRVNGSTKPEGVIPDLFIKDYLLDEEDEILEGLLQHLK